MFLHKQTRRTVAVLSLCLAALPAGAAPSVERGEYLVTGPMGCGNCHSPIGPQGFVAGAELTGRLFEDKPGAYTIYTPNITPAGRVAGWSDAELARAIREGARPDGSLIGPPMPFAFYRGIGDEDLASIVMYLRSVPAVANEVPASTYHIPLPPSYGPPVGSVTPPPAGLTVEYGRYVADLAHCLECHSPMGPQGPMLDTDGGRGGMEFTGPWGVSVSSNITAHADGIAGLSDDDVKTMIIKGIREDGTPMLPPMPYPFLAKMTPSDLDALVIYLRTLPPLPSTK